MRAFSALALLDKPAVAPRLVIFTDFRVINGSRSTTSARAHEAKTVDRDGGLADRAFVRGVFVEVQCAAQ
jgi:hypothetical protein